MTDHIENEFTDEFTDDLEESLGYNLAFDWEDLADGEEARHKEIIKMDKKALQALNLEGLNDFHKWAAAQAFADLEMDEPFDKLVDDVVFSKYRHKALDYYEISVEYFNDLLLGEETDKATEVLSVIRELADDDEVNPARFEAVLLLTKGETESGMSIFQRLLDENSNDPALLLVLADDLISVEQLEAASSVIDKAEEIALSDNDNELKDTIADARAFISEITGN